MRRDIFQAIADPTRRAIIMSLAKETQNVNALAKQFVMTRQAVSLHLKFLQECGVISIKNKGRDRLCSLEIQELDKVQDWLDPVKNLWESRFENLNNLLEKLKTKPR